MIVEIPDEHVEEFYDDLTSNQERNRKLAVAQTINTINGRDKSYQRYITVVEADIVDADVKGY